MNEDYVLFERFIKTSRPNGMHLNLQLIGIPEKFSTSMRDHFEKFAGKRKIPMENVTSVIPSFTNLAKCVKNNDSEYFYIEFFDLKTAKGRNKCRMLYVVGKDERGLAPQLGREFVCGLLDLRDRVDWHRCKMENEDEDKLATALRDNVLKSKIEF